MGRRPLFPPLLDPISRIMLADDEVKGDGNSLGATSIASWQGQSDPAFSPDGMFIAFRGKPAGEAAGLFLANLASEAPVIPVVRLTTGEWDRQPAWKPDGTALAYTSGSGMDNSQIWIVNRDGTDKKRLTDQVSGILAQDPAWNPDGKMLVYSSNATTGKFEIMLMRPDGTVARSLVYIEGGNLQHPSFSPDGNWLAFSSDKDGNSEVYVATADGSRWSNISRSLADDTEPSWGGGK
jgi:TolB protein